MYFEYTRSYKKCENQFPFKKVESQVNFDKAENKAAKGKQSSGKENKGEVKINSVFSNPINTKAVSHSASSSANRLYGGYSNQNFSKLNINYAEILKLINEALANKDELGQLFYSIHNVLSTRMQINCSALGLINKQSKCVNIKLIDKIGSTYSSKIMLADTENPVAKCIKTRKMQRTQDISFLSASYLNNSAMLIFPLVALDECLGVFAVGDFRADMYTDLYQFIGNTIGLFAQNINLLEMVEKNSDTDTLTGLANHKHLQEELAKQIHLAEQSNSQLSICIFDISNISQINRELGHAKGDEIIKTVAHKIKQNIRNTDFAGRYGGDEIAVLMPNTPLEEAKYIAEYLSYTLSCVIVDAVGPIKVSAGIAAYPLASKNQEKLLVLAEQAMYISKSKSYESGNCIIVTSEDYNFWDDEALKCFAEVLTKKHAEIGVDFEEELISKFQKKKIISNKHLLDVVTSLASTIDAKDPYTKGHSTFVSRYSEALARSMRLPEAEVERIKLGALLHDIGKIGIPENVLKKPSMLNDEEWEIMKQHPVIGAEKVLAPNESLRDLIPMVKFHHEHYDGSGYPFGLKGDEIPLSARIVSIADAYHALVSDRPYRKGLGVEKACEILKLGAGVQWDKELVRQFIVIAPSLSTEV